MREWVVDFLASPGSDNAALGELLASEVAHWEGPVHLPFDQLHRLAGPSDQPVLAPFTPEDDARIDEMVTSIVDTGWDPAPLIVGYDGQNLVVEDGNHRIEALRRSGRSGHWSVVCFEDAPAYATFLATHPEAGELFRQADGGDGAG